jgi:tetratricopeptide (TPR) repeat protein
VHRFAVARDHLARAASLGAPREEVDRQSLSIDQACGVGLDAVLAARRRIAAASGRLEDLVPLAALLADIELFVEADAVYLRALSSYDDVSPFPLAWVCFQLGMLWGELVPVPDADLAALWYRRAIAYLPGYVKARVHLAEIYAGQGRTSDAEALLLPALSSGDPEVRWRLADVLSAQERFEEAQTNLDAARAGFEELVRRHRLAFADHAAELGACGLSQENIAVLRHTADERYAALYAVLVAEQELANALTVFERPIDPKSRLLPRGRTGRLQCERACVHS